MNNEIRQTYSDVWAQSCKSFYRYRLGKDGLTAKLAEEFVGVAVFLYHRKLLSYDIKTLR
jgi:hypothetical protein